MECNINDFNFDSYFAALLTPIESPEEIIEAPKERSLGLLCSSTGASNLFFSISKHSLFTNENIEIKDIKSEDNSQSAEGDNNNNNNNNIINVISEQNMQENDLSYLMPIKEENSFESPTPLHLSSNLNSPSSLQEEINSGGSPRATSRAQDVVINSPQSVVVEKVSKKRSSCQGKIEKVASAKRKKLNKALTGVEKKGKRRTNYCFDIHRIYCPHSKKEKFYCNVSLQGKMQETVDLIKGKRGKYAYTFYDQRKQRKERRYWPSQSCGPVIEDACGCKDCHLDKLTQSFSNTDDINVHPLANQVDAYQNVANNLQSKFSLSTSTNPEDNVIFLEEVFLDM